MKVYGVTVISSEGNCITRQRNGQLDWTESFTEIFPDEKAAVDYAITTMIANFDSYDFVEDEEGDVTDYNGQTKKDFEAALRDGENITIQSDDEHISIEMFERELELTKTKTPQKYTNDIDLGTFDVDVRLQSNGKFDVYISHAGNSGEHYPDIDVNQIGEHVVDTIECIVEGYDEYKEEESADYSDLD